MFHGFSSKKEQVPEHRKGISSYCLILQCQAGYTKGLTEDSWLWILLNSHFPVSGRKMGKCPRRCPQGSHTNSGVGGGLFAGGWEKERAPGALGWPIQAVAPTTCRLNSGRENQVGVAAGPAPPPRCTSLPPFPQIFRGRSAGGGLLPP